MRFFFKQGFAKFKDILWVNTFHSILTSQQMFVEKLSSFEASITTRTPEALEKESISIV